MFCNNFKKSKKTLAQIAFFDMVYISSASNVHLFTYRGITVDALNRKRQVSERMKENSKEMSNKRMYKVIKKIYLLIKI